MKFAFEIKTEPVTQAPIIVAVVTFSSGSLATIAIYAQSLPGSVICTVVLAFVVYLALWFSPRERQKKGNHNMDPVEEAPFPPPAPAAVAPPPGPTAASFSGPTVFVLSPLPGNPYDEDRYFYS